MSLHDIDQLRAKRKREFTPEWRAKLSDAMRRRWASPEYREAQLGKIITAKRAPEARKRHSKKLRAFHEDPDRGLKLRAQALRRRIGKMQKQLAEWEKRLGISTHSQFTSEKP